MSGSHEREKRYYEYSPRSGENQGPKHMQTTGVSQDTSTYQYHHAYQNNIQHPSQYQSQLPTPYTTQRPTQQSIQDPDEAPDEYPDESSEEYLDDFSDDSEGGYHDSYLVEHLEDAPFGDRVEDSINDPCPNRCQVSDGHEAQGGCPKAGTAPVTESFQDPSLTAPSSREAHHNLSDQARAPQAAYPGAGDAKLPYFPHLDSNPYGPLAQNITGLELPGNEPPYLTPDIWWVRMSVACGRDLNEIAEELRRTTASVLNFIGKHKLPWTPLQDNQLREMKVDEHSVMSAVRPGLIASGDRYDFEILARANYLALWDDFAQLVAQDDTLQYGSHQYDMDIQYAEPVEAEDTRIPKKKEWSQTEITKLEEWVTEHGRNWENVEKEFPGRSKDACKIKWSHYSRYGPRHRGRGKQVIPPSFGNDSNSQKLRGTEFKGLTKQDFEFIKRSLAQGSRLTIIAREHYHGSRPRTIIKFAFFAGWSPWTPEQDQKLFEMKEQGDEDWLGICNKLPGKLRSQKEVAFRFGYLTRVEHGELPGIIYKPVYIFWLDDDDYIRRAISRGMTFEEMCEEEFPDLTPESVEEHARAISAI